MTNLIRFSHYKPNDWTVTMAPMTDIHAAELCEWRYDPPYDFYNWPAWEDMKKDGIEFGDPVLRYNQYASVLGPGGLLIGFAQFFPLGTSVIRLGLGLRPELCGLGLGQLLVRAVSEEARRRSPGAEVDLEVLTWNARAIRTYEKAGFRIEDTYMRPTKDGEQECHCMVYAP
ncbi:GNAT family N-acetyltransferase [Paenibacillus soyae]|uniref:GNAT family N-acetyltransferase n=1 Tax=Paenibacillus soyae TaxID=2969249 RepID=A0A9X2MWR2_9BACL|nr:GNAT family protein [Paenibacillus soyae]MCR2807840.1 GNAT family N-acetyltransferase [Paenibacillus soyae]